jgi:hypothetical protein
MVNFNFSNYLSEMMSRINPNLLQDYENREPCALRHDEQYSELKQHMNDLKESFGDFHHGGFEGGFNPAFVPPHDGPGGPPPPPPPPHHGHHGHHKHHHHHKEHKGHKKHHGHKHHDEPAPPAPPPAEEELSIHRWFEEGSNPVAADGKFSHTNSPLGIT